MAGIEKIVRSIKQRLSKKKVNQLSRQPISYEEVNRRYEELSAR